jgi:hypothetical protein
MVRIYCEMLVDFKSKFMSSNQILLNAKITNFQNVHVLLQKTLWSPAEDMSMMMKETNQIPVKTEL